MNSINDPDLAFLSECEDDEIRMLSDIISYNQKGKARLTASLTHSKNYHLYYPNEMKKLLPDIVDELQRYGGNTIFNLFRGHGVSYRTILCDVCDSLKVNYNKGQSISLIEQYLIQKILLTAVDNMTEEDVKHLDTKYSKTELKDQIGLLKAGSPLFLKLTTMVVLQVAKKWGSEEVIKLAYKFAGGRVVAVSSGPVGWALSAVWTAFDIASPASRVTVPSVITIAYLRMSSNKSEEINQFVK